MTRAMRGFSLLIVSLLFSSAAWAQGFPGQRPGGSFSPGQGGGAEETKEGPAEEMPSKGDDMDIPELPSLAAFPSQVQKRSHIFQIHGYFRTRGDLMLNLNLSQDHRENAVAPYFVPFSEQTELSCAKRVGTNEPNGDSRGLEDGDCPPSTISGANLRLRLEPEIRPFGSETVVIKSQFDVLDNFVLGSTAPRRVITNDSFGQFENPAATIADGQSPPVAGVNSGVPGILVKRVWAEIMTPFALVKVGRMPVHWGMGLVYNNGDCLDCDYGDNADRISASAEIYGHEISVGYEFASSGPDSLLVNQKGTYGGGQAVDLENLDDASQWVFSVGKFDSAEMIADKLADDKWVFNYGAHFTWRQQEFDYRNYAAGIERDALAKSFIERDSWAIMPDLWVKLMYKNFSLEAEGVIIAGEVDDAKNDNNDKVDPREIFQYGGSVRSAYGFLNNKLKLRLELGFASGDSAEPKNHELNRLRRSGILSPKELRFDPDYHVDLILFREILGTVAGAMYVKPSLSYDILPEVLGTRLDFIWSMAHKSKAFPGDERPLGAEFNYSLYYRDPSDGFHLSFLAGMLIPLSGLDRPKNLFNNVGETAKVAGTIQGNLAIKF